MHELGIVFHMVDLLEETAREYGLSRIAKVSVSLGEVSGVLTDYFEDAWLWAAAKSPVLSEAELEIYRIDAVTVCNDCGKTYSTVEHGRQCPHCGSFNTELLCGNEMLIDSIEGD